MMEFGRFMNSKFDEEKLNKLMDQMDLDKDGIISYEEFLGYFAKVRAPLLGHVSWESCMEINTLDLIRARGFVAPVWSNLPFLALYVHDAG